jgi:hypothetical protein
MKLQNLFKSAPKPRERDFSTFEEYIEAEIGWWERQHRKAVYVLALIIGVLAGVGAMIAMGGAK